jgi:geranylgeranyl pyrophosphate synthase
MWWQAMDAQSESRVAKEAMVIAEIVEMMHLATKIHDTILEEGDALDKGNPAHRCVWLF